MKQREPIELLPINEADSQELQILKIRYNRCAEQTNATRGDKWTQEDESIWIELEYIKREIDSLWLSI